jgi:hypothetical protein
MYNSGITLDSRASFDIGFVPSSHTMVADMDVIYASKVVPSILYHNWHNRIYYVE